MKKSLLIFIAFLFLNRQAEAHLINQPSYFKVNDEYADYYPINVSSTEKFLLPQDKALRKYLVNTPINFEIDTVNLPAPTEALQSIIDHAQFLWDFGDGEKGSGLTNSHTYTKMGSYVITIYVQDNINPPQLLESMFLNIIPSEDYQVPQSFIKVNHTLVDNPLGQILPIELDKPLTFTATLNDQKAVIKDVLWDTGDGEISQSKTFQHQYSKNNYYMILLRVKDQNGFISDVYAQLDGTQAKMPDKKTTNYLPIIEGGVVLLAATTVFLIIRRQKKTSQK